MIADAAEKDNTPAAIAQVIVTAASANGLASPSTTAVRGDRLYITGGRVPEPHDPKLRAAGIDFPALLASAAH